MVSSFPKIFAVFALFLVTALAVPSAAAMDMEARRRSDVQKLGALTVFAAIDYKQSAEMYFELTGYHELNPVLGRYPSRTELAAFGVVGVVLAYGVSEFIRSSYPAFATILINTIVRSEQENIEWNRTMMNGARRPAQLAPILLTWEW